MPVSKFELEALIKNACDRVDANSNKVIKVVDERLSADWSPGGTVRIEVGDLTDPDLIPLNFPSEWRKAVADHLTDRIIQTYSPPDLGWKVIAYREESTRSVVLLFS